MGYVGPTEVPTKPPYMLNYNNFSTTDPMFNLKLSLDRAQNILFGSNPLGVTRKALEPILEINDKVLIF